MTPESAAKLLDFLAVPTGRRAFSHLGKAGRLVGGTAIPEPAGIFPRYIDPAEAEKPAGASAEAQQQAKAAKEAKRAAEREKSRKANDQGKLS